MAQVFLPTQAQVDAKYGPGGTDVPLADGGTGASTAAAALANLGAVAKTDVGALRLFPERFRASVGAPTLTSLNTRWPIWSFAKGATEQVSGMWTVPGDWNTVAVDLMVANMTADAGDVRWMVDFIASAAGESLNATPVSIGLMSVTALGQYLLQVIELATAIAVVPGKLQGFRLGRAGASGLDTKAGASALVAVQIRRLT